MLDRLLIVAAVLAATALAIWLVRVWLAARDRRIVARLRVDAGGTERDGSGDVAPRIVYFTTTSCVVCRLQQEPAIEDLQEALPEIVIERYDAVAEGELADEYGVLSVPTTAVYDRAGELVTINRGFAPVVQLYAQATGGEAVAEGGVAMASERVDRPPA